jgi:hypothetical protein
MKIISLLSFYTVTVILTMLVTACGNSNTSFGTLSLKLTDAPVDGAEHVYIQFRGIEIQGDNGTRITINYCQDPANATQTIVSLSDCTTPAAPKKIDLLALSNGLAEEILNGYTLPAGYYNNLRLLVDTAGVEDSYIVIAGVKHELTIPSGSQTGLKLNRNLTILAGGSADFTIDFDLRKSVHLTGNNSYILRPTLRIADNTLAGSITGTVNALSVVPGCTPAIYVFMGANVTPDDIDGIPAEPVTTAIVKLNNDAYRYKASFLEAGDYTVAYTCQATVDNPDVNDALTFTGIANVFVAAKVDTAHNF